MDGLGGTSGGMVVAVGTGRAVCGSAVEGSVVTGFSAGIVVLEEGVAGVGAGAPGPPCTKGAWGFEAVALGLNAGSELRTLSLRSAYVRRW